MRRYVRQLILPAIIAVLAVGSIFALASFKAWQAYRTASNAELAGMLGVVSAAYPELDSAALMRALTAKDARSQAAGAEILQSYGYTASDFVSPSAKSYGYAIFGTAALAILLAILGLEFYLWYRDWCYRQHIRRLVNYVQKLNDHVYDLRIEANTEDELSLLSNELYKITVTLREAAEQDRKARQRLAVALADISHQLKTPLTSLQVALDNLIADPDMPPAIRQDFLQSSVHQVVAMTDLITTLLHLARFDNGTIRMQRHVMPIGTLLQQVERKLEILADLQNIRIRIVGDLSAQVKLDRHWQTEALANIVKNCLEHSPAGSTVTITAEDSVLYTRITITDQGEGISPQDLHHIFERFYKAQNSNATSVGIGLAFAKSIIEADHGQIRAKSTPGIGSTFTVTYFH